MSEHDDDRALVDRILSGDRAAFESFAERYSRALYRFASAKLGGDRELTREIVQIALCKILANLESYRGEAALLTWACACCRNEILMHFRRQATRPDETALDEADVRSLSRRSSPGRDPESAVLHREASARVHTTLESLPERYGRALEWKYLEHLPVVEIAERLGTSAKAAESLLTRARAAFRTGYEGLAAERNAFVAEDRRTGASHG